MIAGVVGLVAGISIVAFVGSMKWYGIADIIIGGGLILMVSLSSVLAAFFSRTGRYGLNLTIVILAFTGILVVINFVSFQHNSRTDVTATKQFSLFRSANYLLDDFSLISIFSKEPIFREFNLNRNEYNFVRFSSWLFMPGLLGLMAALVWWVRR